jgi:hypothetical protein
LNSIFRARDLSSRLHFKLGVSITPQTCSRSPLGLSFSSLPEGHSNSILGPLARFPYYLQACPQSRRVAPPTKTHLATFSQLRRIIPLLWRLHEALPGSRTKPQRRLRSVRSSCSVKLWIVKSQAYKHRPKGLRILRSFMSTKVGYSLAIFGKLKYELT